MIRLFINFYLQTKVLGQDQAIQRAKPTGKVALDMNSLAQLSIPTTFGNISLVLWFPPKEGTNYHSSTVKNGVKTTH